jgi:phosphoserine phosphatase
MNVSTPGGRLVHVYAAGEDRPGILAAMIGEITRFHWDVRDIKQFVFNGLLNLSMLVEGTGNNSVEVLGEALNRYSQTSGVKVTLHPQPDRNPLDTPYRYRSVVTLLGRRIDSLALQDLTRTFANIDINILRIEQLDSGDQHVLEFLVGARKPMPVLDVLNELVRFKENHQVDIAVQEDSLFRRNKRLIVMDADMTFLQCEVIDKLGEMAGVEQEMKEITHQAMSGNMSFPKALRQRVKLLKGLPLAKLKRLANHLPLTPGAEELVRILQHLNFKIAIVSGGFQLFIDTLKRKYGLDYGFANRLKVKNGKLTGEVEGDIIDAKAKARILKTVAAKEGFTLRQVVAVGDGANDIHMLAEAGLGIAFNAKPIVQKHARAHINVTNLELILYFLGIDGKDLSELRQMIQEKPRRRTGRKNPA